MYIMRIIALPEKRSESKVQTGIIMLTPRTYFDRQKMPRMMKRVKVHMSI